MMSGRVHDRAPAAAVGMALNLLTPKLRELTACEFIIGADPIFAGITVNQAHWNLPANFYRSTAHCLYDIHQTHRPRSDRGPKVVLPSNPQYGWEAWRGVKVVVHELGHVLHYRTGLDHVADPVSEYAKTNHREAFAEAFAEWIWGAKVDAKTEALFGKAAR